LSFFFADNRREEEPPHFYFCLAPHSPLETLEKERCRMLRQEKWAHRLWFAIPHQREMLEVTSVLVKVPFP